MLAGIRSNYCTVKTDSFPLTSSVSKMISCLRIRSVEILVNAGRAGKRDESISPTSQRRPSIAIDFVILTRKPWASSEGFKKLTTLHSQEIRSGTTV